MSTPAVSVVIPTFNRRDWIVSLVRSLAEQTLARDRYEVLVVDNTSSDGTAARVAELAREVPFTLRCYQKENRGPWASRNLGVEQASGEFIAFIDSDCVATPGWLAAGLAAFAERTGLVQGQTLPNPSHPKPALFKSVTVTSEGPYYETCNMFYRRSAILAAGGFSPEFEEHPWGEDLDLAMRVKQLGYSSAFAPDALVYHHVIPLRVGQWLMEPLNARRWPYLVRKHPDVRRALFLRVFLTRMTALFDLAVLGVILAVFLSPWFALLALPFVVTKYREGGAHLTAGMRIVRVGAASVRAAVIFGTLLWGSVRFRSVLL